MPFEMPVKRPTLKFEEELAREIRQALGKTGYAELEQLEIIVNGHDVCLRGGVSSYFLRQKAECAISSVTSISKFQSLIEVNNPQAP